MFIIAPALFTSKCITVNITFLNKPLVWLFQPTQQGADTFVKFLKK